MQGLYQFVSHTLDGLIAEAERHLDGPSQLRDFARVDVSFMKGGHGEAGFDYFVNEIELGGNGVCMFSAYSNAAEIVMDELFGVILARHENRLGVSSVRRLTFFNETRYRFPFPSRFYMGLPWCHLRQWEFSFSICMTFLTIGHVGISYHTENENREFVLSPGRWETYGSFHNRQEKRPPVASVEKLGMT
jgi:hypothetical protein